MYIISLNEALHIKMKQANKQPYREQELMSRIYF